MDKQDWAPEPWTNGNRHVTNADENYVGYLQDFSDSEQTRIIACVNACAGVPTEVLNYMRYKVEKLGLITLPQEAPDDN